MDARDDPGSPVQVAVIVADSDVLIDALRGRHPVVGRVDALLASGELVTTVITAFELFAGVRSSSSAGPVEQFLEQIDILGLDERAARRAAEVRRRLEGAGQGIGTADDLIAGICLSRGFPLLTGNRKHFERVAGLALA